MVELESAVAAVGAVEELVGSVGLEAGAEGVACGVRIWILVHMVMIIVLIRSEG